MPRSLPEWVLGIESSCDEMAAAVVAFTVLDLLLSRLYLPDQVRCR